MAQFSVNNSNNRFTLTLTVTETNYSVTDNTSTLSWSLDLKANTAYNFSKYSIGLSVVLNGTTVKSQTRAQYIQYSIDDYGTVNLASGSGFVVNHNDDGTKTIPVAFSIDMATQSYTPGPLDGSGTMKLTDIARYSTLSIPTGSSLGVKQTIKVTRPSSQTHTVSWVCGTEKGTLCTKSTDTTIYFTPDIALAAQNTAEPSVTITYTINTTDVGSKTYSVAYKIPDSVKPKVDTEKLVITDATSYYNTYGGYVQGWSKLLITCTPTLAYGSPISSYTITADGKTYTSNPATTEVIRDDSKVVVSAVVKDARERTSEPVTKEVAVIPYTPPVVTLDVYRCDQSGNRSEEGAYMKISMSAEISSLNGKNAATYTITYSGAASGKIEGSGETYTSDAIECDSAKACSVSVVVNDALSNGTATSAVPIAFTLMEFYHTGKGVAFGKVASWDGFDCAMDARFTGATALPASVTIGSKSVAAFVTECGTSGIWTYRKWSNGIAECWGTSDEVTVTTWNSWGGMYTAANVIKAYNYPFTFKSIPALQITYRAVAMGGLHYVESTGTTTATPAVSIMRGTSATGLKGCAHFYAIGKIS